MNSATVAPSVVRSRYLIGAGLTGVLLLVAVPEARGPVVAVALLCLYGWLRTPTPEGDRRSGPAAVGARIVLSAAALVALVAVALVAALLHLGVVTGGLYS